MRRMRKLGAKFIGKGDDDEKEDSTQEKSSANDTKEEAEESKNYGFYVIDQTDRHNIILAAMIRGLLSLKNSTKVATIKAYTDLIFNEIDARIKDLANSEGNDELIQSFKKMKKDIKVYLNTNKKAARASKNILRVMLGSDPVHPKTPTEPLFAVEQEKKPRSNADVAAKAAQTKLKKKKPFTRK